MTTESFTKPIKAIRPWSIKYGYKGQDLMYDYSANIILKSPKDICDAFTKARCKLTSPSTLYFTKSSHFPRFKLQGTDFKRCIKDENADFIIVSDSCLKSINDIANWYKQSNLTKARVSMFIEDEDYILFIDDKADIENALNTKNIINSLIAKQALKSKNPSVLYEGSYVKVDNHSDYLVYKNILDGIYTNIVLDSELDREINSLSESLDEDSLDSISEMLSSTDPAIVDMGLKLLPNYNCLEYPLTITTIMRLHDSSCRNSGVWNSTSVKQLIRTLDYKSPWSTEFPTCIENIGKDNVNYSEKDKELARKLVLSGVNEALKKITDRLEKTVARYGITINVSAE